MLTGALIVAAGMLAIVAATRLRARVSLRITPIAETPDATLVRIKGRVSSDTVLRAPYSQLPCVYYHLELTCAQFNREAHYEHSDGCDFTVTDATGTAVVHRERAQFEAMPSDGEMGRASRLSDRARQVIQALGWQVPEIASASLAETVIAVGDSVEVAGIPTREPGVIEVGERGFRDAPPTQLVFASDVYVVGRGQART
ncbi:MAG TPA: hypothetical protein VIV11_27455 [Kofleriaceae bacterium]